MTRLPHKIVRGHTVPPRDTRGRREGFTTGTAAAAAAKAACLVLLDRGWPETVSVRLPIERDADRHVVVDLIVVEARVELVDAHVDEQMIDIGQLADDMYAAAGDGGGVRRQRRVERAHVGIERRVGPKGSPVPGARR